MGDIIGGIIGGVGSLIGGNKAAKQDLTGYNYLTGANGVGGMVQQGAQANSNANALLTGGPNSPAAKSAFGNYLNSTGFNFQKQQGQQMITGSAAARGLLGSGATGKALAAYGNNLASTGFNNYLGELGNVAGRGLQASGQIGQAGTQGGVAGGNALQGGISSAGGQLGGAASAGYNNFMGNSSIPGQISVTPNQVSGNYFGGV